MRTSSLLGWSLVALSAIAFAACSGTGNGATQGVGGSAFTGGPGGAGGTASTGTGQGGDDGGSLFDASSGTGGGVGGGSSLIYASTDTDLFTLDPQDPSLTLSHVGAFDCIPSMNSAMVDIAVNKKGELWGITGHDAYPLTIQGATVHCGNKVQLNDPATGPRFYALSFAPEGVVDPAQEVLVAGNTAGELWVYDLVATTFQQHGSFGTVPTDDGRGHAYTNAGKLWELSGDIVFLANSGSPVGFATVRDCPNPPNSTTGCNKIDTLIEIDMTMLAPVGSQNVTKAVRGQILKSAGCSDPGTDPGYGSMYGIAAWEGQVYGFSRTGNLVPISNVDGSACLKHNYSPNQFSGAAVTTLAPVLPPPPIN
jgi:hypothetical protein